MKNVTVSVSLDIAKATFDIAVGSMDFGSGFLDNEECDSLRAFATAIGVDPMEATPHAFRRQYQHAYKPHTYRHYNYNTETSKTWESCDWCGLEADNKLHG